MAIKYRNTSNYLAYKDIPVQAVLQNGNYIYGGPANGQSTYEVTWNTPAKVYSAFQVELTDSTDPFIGTGSIVNNPTKDGGVLIVSGSTIAWDIQTTTDPGYTDATYTVTSGGAEITSPHVVTGDVVFDFKSTVRSYTLSYTPSAGCAYVRVKRVGGVGYKGTDDVQFLEFTDAAQRITIYYGDILTIQEFYPPSVGYNMPTVTLGYYTDKVTGNVSINIVDNPKEYKLVYPALQTGFGFALSRNGTGISTNADGGELSVYYGETYTLRAYGSQYYKSPETTLREEATGQLLEYDTYSLSSYGYKTIERARIFDFTIGESDYILTIPTPERCDFYSVATDIGVGAGTYTLTLYHSPYYYSGANSSISSVSSFEWDTSMTELPIETCYSALSVDGAEEGYAWEDRGLIDAEGDKLASRDAIETDVTLLLETSQGVKCTIVYPAFPDGVSGLTIKRTSSKYSRELGEEITCLETGGSFMIFGQVYCYNDDVLQWHVTREDLWSFPTVGVADDMSTGLSGDFVTVGPVDNLIIQPGVQATIVTFTNTADDVAGWWDFKVESDYLNSAIGITSEIDRRAYISTGTYNLCLGDRLWQNGKEIIYNGNGGFYFRHFADKNYRSPSCTIYRDGIVFEPETRVSYFGVTLNQTGAYTTGYTRGAEKTRACASDYVGPWTDYADDSVKTGNFTLTSNFEDYLVDGVLEAPVFTTATLSYKAKRYVGDGITVNFPTHTVTGITNGGSFDEDWEATQASITTSMRHVLVGSISWTERYAASGTAYVIAAGTMSFSKYNEVYVGSTSTTGAKFRLEGVV